MHKGTFKVWCLRDFRVREAVRIRPGSGILVWNGTLSHAKMTLRAQGQNQAWFWYLGMEWNSQPCQDDLACSRSESGLCLVWEGLSAKP
eukprot:1157249-Pelagomonas_calceolata.AAC.3